MLKSKQKEFEQAETVAKFFEGQEGLIQWHMSRWKLDRYGPGLPPMDIEIDLSAIDPKYFVYVMLQQAYNQGKAAGRREKTDEINNVLKYDEE